MRDSGYFKSNQEQLYYTAHVPQDLDCSRTGVIFIHADGGNRFGPHRMFVEFAEKLSSRYVCVRFDLSGCGDSSGDSQNSSAAHQEDIIAAIDYFRDLYDLDQIILLGISRGAHLIYQMLSGKSLPVDGAILLSCPVSSQKAAVRTFSKRLKEYSLKLRDIQSIKKLLTGKVNIKYIFKSLTTALSLKQRYAVDKELKDNTQTNCPRLFIYGQNDPICTEAMEVYQQDCQNNNMTLESYVISYANHSFFHYIWKEEVYIIIRRWLDGHKKEGSASGETANAIISE